MAETDSQREVMTYAIEALKTHFREREDIYVSVEPRRWITVLPASRGFYLF